MARCGCGDMRSHSPGPSLLTVPTWRSQWQKLRHRDSSSGGADSAEHPLGKIPFSLGRLVLQAVTAFPAATGPGGTHGPWGTVSSAGADCPDPFPSGCVSAELVLMCLH